VLAINNAGTIELAAVNIAGGNNLDEAGMVNTTAEGGAGGADSATAVYSTTARTGVPFRVIGYIESTQATAGTWATAPSTIQGCGGQALHAMSSLGYGQTWQALSGSRSLGTTYYNTTGRPIYVFATPNGSTTAGLHTLTVDGLIIGRWNNSAASSGYTTGIGGIIPPGSSYVIAMVNPIGTWQELR
jgi:hypothetical protein